MTPEGIAVVQESFQQVASIADQAAEIFYRHLFALDPQLKRLFPSDMHTQRRKPMQMLGLVAHGLKSPDTLIPAVHALGRRHVAYGVEVKGYETAGKALILTLKRGLGADLTPHVRQAWLATYQLLAETMKQATSEVSAHRLHGCERVTLQNVTSFPDLWCIECPAHPCMQEVP